MLSKNNSINNSFKKGFDLIYHSKVHCPVCKELIYNNALKCPHCKTDFKKTPYNHIKNWQKIPLRIIFIISLVIGLTISFSDAPAILGLIVGLLIYSIGHFLIHQIQNFKNFHNNK